MALDADTDESTQVTDTDEATKPAAGRAAAPAPGKRPTALLAGLGVALVAAVAAAVFGFVQSSHKQALADAQAAARDAACANATAWTTVDYRNLDAWQNAVLAGAGDTWRDQFKQTIGQVRDLYTQSQLVSHTDAAHCGVSSADENHAEVVVLVEQTVTSLVTDNKAQKTQLPFISTVDKTDGRWTVGKVDMPGLAAGAAAPAAPAPAPR